MKTKAPQLIGTSKERQVTIHTRESTYVSSFQASSSNESLRLLEDARHDVPTKSALSAYANSFGGIELGWGVRTLSYLSQNIGAEHELRPSSSQVAIYDVLYPTNRLDRHLSKLVRGPFCFGTISSSYKLAWYSCHPWWAFTRKVGLNLHDGKSE